MKYKLRLNENPEFEVEANHCETHDDRIIIEDTGIFEILPKEIIISKIELIGEDNEIYAMRKLPPHLTYTLTNSMQLTVRFELTLAQSLVS